jgi:dolichol-phosphate mannosyltransferase
LLDALADADVVFGSRWVSGGRTVNWPLYRQFISRGGSLYSRLALGVPFRDVTGGYRAYRMNALDKMDVETVTSQGYCFQVDLAWRAHKNGFRSAEVPITFAERERGNSKMNTAIVREALWRVTVWGASARLASLKKLVSGQQVKV